MFGERLQQLRKQKNMNQEQIAEVLQVNTRTYGSWERNEREPDFLTLCKIADFHKVSADYLLGRTEMIVSVQQKNPPAKAEGEEEIVISLDEPDIPARFDAHIRKLIRQELSRLGNE